MFESIKESKSWIKIELIDKGWSRDKKYHIYDSSGLEYLLRVSDISLYDKRFKQFELLKQIQTLKIPASIPIAFGHLNDHEVYMLLTWVKGEDASEVITKLSLNEQYNLGLEAGRILQLLHTLPVMNNISSWYERYQTKIKNKIQTIQECSIELPCKDIIIQYVLDHIDLMKDRPLRFQHGDYHLGNMIVHQGHIAIIDFDKFGVADPYDEFKPFYWNVRLSPSFETGLIDGYFNHQIPENFFPLLALYAAESLLGHLPWAISYGEEEIKTALKLTKDTLEYYDNFHRTIPSWYGKK